jgi:hypothetical protein
MLALLGLLFVFWMVDSLNSYVHFATGRVLLYPPSNLLRLLTGMGNGLLLSIVVVPMFNFSIWREPSKARIVQDWRELAVIGLQSLVVAIVVHSGSAALLYPVVAASVVGLLLTLTTVNGVIADVFLRRENRALSWRQALLPLACGFLLAIAEVGTMAILRHLLADSLLPPVA